MRSAPMKVRRSPVGGIDVLFASVVAYMQQTMPEIDWFIASTLVFRSLGVHHIPLDVKRIISFNLKFIPHCNPNLDSIFKGFEKFKRTCHNRM